MSKPTDLVQGTLDLLILKTIALEPMHGWGIARRIRQVSKEVLQVNQGALYPALHRLEQSGWIKAKWGVTLPCASWVAKTKSKRSAAICDRSITLKISCRMSATVCASCDAIRALPRSRYSR